MNRLGRYEIRDRIGCGAMADVYRAFDPSINRVLAIKVLKPEFRQSSQYAARFLREAKAAGALSHPNIVTIFDVGVEAGYPYIAMELLEGEPLDKLLRRGERPTPDVVVAIGRQLAEALSYAHALGVVHRDVKPSNVVIGKDGRSVKLLDFGIASLAEVELAAEDAVLRTQVGQILGTPRYMSPEQALSRPADGRSDLFSVGVVLYELITGRHAFDGANAIALALQITQSEPPPIAKLAPDCPAGLQFIVGKLLSKKPEKRFADGAQLIAALQREQGERQLPAGRGRPLPLPSRMALIMGAITACVLAASVNAVLSRQDQTLQRMAFTSGAAITSFIANNAAVTAADNATLPPDQRDWLPVQAFVRTAADDPNVSRIMIVDDAGVIRASSLLSDIGQPYRAPAHEPMLERRDSLSIWDASGQTLRFERPIIYAGRAFGRVDVSVKKADLNAAAEQSRLLLAFLSLVTLGAVVTVSYVTARAVVLPIRRLRRALQDAGGGDFDFRISHSRRDEFGELFDGFNQLVATAQARLDSAEADQSGAFAVQRQDTPDTALPTDLFTAAADGDCDRTQITTPIDQSMPTTAQAAPDPGLVKRLRNLKRA